MDIFLDKHSSCLKSKPSFPNFFFYWWVTVSLHNVWHWHSALAFRAGDPAVCYESAMILEQAFLWTRFGIYSSKASTIDCWRLLLCKHARFAPVWFRDSIFLFKYSCDMYQSPVFYKRVLFNGISDAGAGNRCLQVKWDAFDGTVTAL